MRLTSCGQKVPRDEDLACWFAETGGEATCAKDGEERTGVWARGTRSGGVEHWWVVDSTCRDYRTLGTHVKIRHFGGGTGWGMVL